MPVGVSGLKTGVELAMKSQGHSIESEKWPQSSQPQSWARSSKLWTPSFDVCLERVTARVIDWECLHLGKHLQP